MGKSYLEKLKHPKWQRKRLEILNRDEFTCRTCNCKETTLHIHHKKYIKNREPWEYEDENFITLCEHCHRITEIIKKELIRVFIYDIGEEYMIYYALMFGKENNSYTVYIFFIGEKIFDFRVGIGSSNLNKLINEIQGHKQTIK